MTASTPTRATCTRSAPEHGERPAASVCGAALPNARRALRRHHRLSVPTGIPRVAGDATRSHRRGPGTAGVVAARRAHLVVSLAEGYPATRRCRLSLHRAGSCGFWPLRQTRGAGLVLIRQPHTGPGLADRRPRPSWGDAGDARLGWPHRFTGRDE